MTYTDEELEELALRRMSAHWALVYCHHPRNWFVVARFSHEDIVMTWTDADGIMMGEII